MFGGASVVRGILLRRLSDPSSAARLVALFHLAQSVTLVGSYLRTGRGSSPALMSRLDRHRDQALNGLAVAGRIGDDLRQISELLWVGCRELVRNSIWSHVDGLGAQLTELAKHLADPGRERPVLELWPSQQEALAGNVLDQYRRAVLVQMPTSAGKTLLAEFLIVQSRALLPDSTAAYVVPTRALVNQVTRDLRSDLGPLGLSVEQAVSAYELDPAEQVMLSERPEVLVATPEKLSLLIRRNDPSVAELGLVIVDEAHNLGDGARGARLELLLATIRRDKPGVRYLLLSPFLPNAQQLVDWLGEDRGLPPITVRWKPGRRVVATAKVGGRRPNRQLLLETLDAAGGADLRAGHQINLGAVSNEDLTGSKSIKSTTRLAVRELRRRGTTLILCWGRATAMTRTAELAAGEPILPAHPLREAVASYLDAELGDVSALARFIRSGFAYHHSGMSHEARSLVECLVRNDLVHTVCGTTTLAQGVNFPITNVLIETSRKGQDASLSYADLWNIIGRAGRALVDDAGLVVFPVAEDAQADKWQEYMRGEAREIASQLSTLIDQADQLGAIGLREVRATPELGDMLQFLAHAMHVGGAQQTSAELEDLLRSSLVYRQASTAPGRSDKLIGLCRRYLEQISTQPGQAALSDQTGFSTPTIGMILGHRADSEGFTDPAAWQPNALFGAEQTPLTERMRVLGEVPELGLGWEAVGTFNPERVARIVSGWVNGRTLMQLADEFGDADSTDAETKDKEVAKFASYLYSTVSYKASWGLGALESAYLPTPEEPDPTDASRYVPSMVYFGVKTPQAVWMRMAGLPRVAAEQLGALWQARVGAPPSSHSELRGWVDGLSESDWDQAISGDRLAGAEMKRLWDDALA